MGAQAPPSMLCFVAAIVTTIFSIIALALSANLCSYGYCTASVSPILSGATGVGITAGVLSMLLGILSIAWLLISDLWDVGIMRFILLIGFSLTSLFSFVSAVLYLTGGTYGHAVLAINQHCSWRLSIFVTSSFGSFSLFMPPSQGRRNSRIKQASIVQVAQMLQ